MKRYALFILVALLVIISQSAFAVNHQWSNTAELNHSMGQSGGTPTLTNAFDGVWSTYNQPQTGWTAGMVYWCSWRKDFSLFNVNQSYMATFDAANYLWSSYAIQASNGTPTNTDYNGCPDSMNWTNVTGITGNTNQNDTRTFTYTGTNRVYRIKYFTGGAQDANGPTMREWQITGNNETPTINTTNLTVAVNDTRASSFISGFFWVYTTSNASDTNTKSGYCSVSNCSVTNFTGTINVTFTNITGGYFNTTSTGYTYTSSLNAIVGQTYRNTLTMNLSNVVNGSRINDFCGTASNTSDTQTNCTASGDLSFAYLNGNTTLLWYNVSGGTYYNVSTNIGVFNSTGASYTNTTYQGLLNTTAYQLLSNASISGFNVNNSLVTNTTSTGSLTIPANSGSNNIKVNVAGNYSLNATCTAASLSLSSCIVTGIYDNLFTIGARYNGAGISNFTVNVSNATLGGALYNTATTNGSIVFPLLQGYYYTFNINATGYSLSNTTQPANASTNLYNFTVLTLNTFNLTFRNESTNSVLSGQNITIQLISDLYANNYTTSTGTINISLLTPGEYTIRYWLDSSVPRDYYTTLTPQSFQDISLYIIDAGISTLYLPIIKDQNGRALSDATVKLLRYYIITGNTGEYRTVEMGKTDVNGQAVLRVVPNIINYKLMITKDGRTLTTTPMKLTSSTNTYTLNTQSSPLTSIANIDGVTQNLSYNSNTHTFVFTWGDDSNLVSSGCMKVTKFNSTITTVMDQCSDGSSGSLIYMVTDTNQTQYNAQSTLHTNTQFSTYSDLISIDFRTKYQVWGTIGLFLTLLVFLVFSFMGAGSTETTVLYGIGAIFLMSAFGVIFGNYQSIIGILIIVGIIMYKTRT